MDRAAFEADLTEADGPGRWHGSLFDTWSGLGVLQRCAPLLDLDPFCDPDVYLARRTELGVAEVDRRLLTPTGISDFVVDTGFAADTLTPPDELAAVTGGRGHEIVRLEQVAEQVIARRPDDYAAAFAAELDRRAAGAAGFKCIAAYRVGLDLDPEPPTPAEVAAAAQRWVSMDGPPRLADPVLIRHGFWTAAGHGKPIQFHIGYGDADVDLHRCDPLLLTPLLRATAGRGVPVMLLHNYPFQRHAGYLAQVFDHVFVDVGLAVQNVGGGARRILAELLELAPFGSVLFSTDAFALPELYLTSTAAFHDAFGAFADDALQHGELDVRTLDRLAAMITSGNARRAYGLDTA
ncbi:amidohydrolase family protein [Jatrophihabitans fulvus]